MDILIRDEQTPPVNEKRLRRLIDTVLSSVINRDDREVSVLITDADGIRQLNERFRGKDVPTDVLAFPLEGPVEQDDFPGPTRMLGDIVLSPHVIREDAAAEDKSFEEAFDAAVVHGLLHLIGYDHVSDAQAEAMKVKEAALIGHFRRVGGC